MDPENNSRKFYAMAWRWHFYAGLFVVPFMVILSVTGIIYLFKPQLDALMYRNLMFVEKAASAATPDAQAATVVAAYPGAKILKFRPNWEPERSSEFDVATTGGRELKVFVDPYENRVRGALDNKNTLQYYAFEIHGKLMAGRVGEWIIELAVCWALVLLVSGLYMWFPRNGEWIYGVIIPRLNRGMSRLFWRDLHAVTGFWGAVLVAFMIATGLPWTDFWGKNILRSRESYPLAGRSKPKSAVPMSSLNGAGEKSVPWTVEDMPLAESEHAGHENHVMPGRTKEDAAARPIGLTRSLEIAVANRVPNDSIIAPPQDPDGIYAITAFPDDPALQTTLHLDQYSGAILTDVRWKDYKLLPRTVEMGISLHEGKYFGFANQLIMFIAAFSVLLLALSGTIMWWKRRPKGRLGAPPMPHELGLWKSALAIIFVMSIAFPLVGLSILVAFLVEFAVVRRIPAFRNAVG